MFACLREEEHGHWKHSRKKRDAFFCLYKDVFNTHKIFLKFLHLLLVALQTAVVHGSALNRNLTNLQVHLLELETPIKFSVNKQTISHIILIQKQLNCLASLMSTRGSAEASIQAPGKSSHVRRCRFIKTSGAVELWQLRHVSVSHVSKPACTKGPRWFTLSNQHDMMGQFTCDTHPSFRHLPQRLPPIMAWNVSRGVT